MTTWDSDSQQALPPITLFYLLEQLSLGEKKGPVQCDPSHTLEIRRASLAEPLLVVRSWSLVGSSTADLSSTQEKGP